MALEIHTRRDAATTPVALISDRRLWLSADRAQVVEEGDQRAAFLLAGQGSEIPAAEVERLGLGVMEGRIMILARAETETAARPPSSNKARRKGQDK